VAQDFVCAATDTHASPFEPLVPIARTTPFDPLENRENPRN